MRVSFALLFGILLTGCSSSFINRPIRVAGFAAPPEGVKGDYVLLYHPWEGAEGEVKPRGQTRGLGRLRDLKITCDNVKCLQNPGSEIVAVQDPPPSLNHLELVVTKDGYEPTHVTVPYGEGASSNFLVLLPVAAPVPPPAPAPAIPGAPAEKGAQ
jgi:hypothetical protein